MSETRVAAARFVGRRLPRKEDARLLTGRGTYTDDVALPGMLHVAFVRSPIAKGVIRSIDIAAAAATPGVFAVLVAEDLDRFDVQMASMFLIVPPPGPKVHPLAKARVAHVGDPVAMVLAADRYAAEDAAALVFVDYDEEEPVVTLDAARTGPLVHPGIAGNVAAAERSPDDPELERILAAAPHLVTGTIRHQRIAQSPMEARAIVASANGANELTVWMSCQSPHLVARHLSLAFGVPQTGITVIARDVGGAFGQKAQPWREEIATVAASLILGRPCKWIEDRLENLTAANQAREQDCEMRVAFDAQGRLLAAHTRFAQNNGAYPHAPDANLLAMIFMWAPYKLPAYGYDAVGLHTNTIGHGGYRGPWAIEALARETILDVAARQIGIDAVELRRRNLIGAADQPFTTPFGFHFEDVTTVECLDKLMAAVDVAAFRAEQAAARRQGRYLGLGVATYIEPTAASGFSVLASDIANLRIETNGKVIAILSTHSQGHGSETTMAQVIAEAVGVRFEDVIVLEDNSSRGGYGPGAAGSRQAVSGGGASIRAAELLVDKVKRVAAHLLNAAPGDVTIEGGMVRIAGAEEMTRPLAEIAQIAYDEPGRLPEGMESGLEAQYRYHPPDFTYSSAAHACIVEVDAETGFVRIRRWVVAEDCGVMINPSIVEGQIAGGLVQAIGTVLLEEMSFDERGNPTAATFKDYLMPAIEDAPDFEYLHVVTPSQTPGGFRGVGEGGAIIGPPTLVNAIADALAPFGGRCLDLPLSPARILAIIEAAEARAAA